MRAIGPTVIGLMGGEVDSASVPVPDTIEQHKAGKLKILGVSATERHFMAPEIPTFREQGFDVVVGLVALHHRPERHPGGSAALSRDEHHRRAQGSRISRPRPKKPALS